MKTVDPFQLQRDPRVEQSRDALFADALRFVEHELAALPFTDGYPAGLHARIAHNWKEGQ